MVKRKASRAALSAAIGERAVKRLADDLHRAGYMIEETPRVEDKGFDLLAVSHELGRPRRHYIQVKAGIAPVRQDQVQQFVAIAQRLGRGNEYWLVANSFSTLAMLVAGSADNVRLFKWDELDRLLKGSERETKTSKRSVGRIGRIVATNKREIVLLAASLAELLDDKIHELRGERPNDPDSIQAVAKSLSEYEELRAKVAELQAAVAKFKAATEKSKEISKKASAWQIGFEKWAMGGRNPAFSTGFGMGLFLLGTGLCSLIGVPPNEAAYLSAALAGGSSVAAAVKSLGRRD